MHLVLFSSCILVWLVCCLVVSVGAAESGVSHSATSLPPYPAPSRLPTTVYQISYINRSHTDQLLLITLQGCLSKLGSNTSSTQGSVVLTYKITSNGSGQSDDDSEWWYWNFYSQQEEFRSRVQFDSKTLFNADLLTILKTIGSPVTGYYLTAFHEPPEADPVNVAVSLASITPGSIVATAEHVSLLRELNIPMLRDVSSMTEQQLIFSYQPLNQSSGADPWPWSTRFFSCQTPSKATSYLTDWTILAGAVQLHHIPTANAILKWLTTTNELWAWLGWTADTWSENGMTGEVSAAGGVVWAADTLHNLGTHAYFRTREEAQGQPLHNPTKANPNKLPDNTHKHTVSFLWTDADSLCADMNGIADRTRWSHPLRDTVVTTYGINPSLSHLAPGLLNWYYNTSGSNTSIVAFSPGYAYPDYMINDYQRYRWAQVGAEAMFNSDVHIDYFIGFNYSWVYAEPLLAQFNVDGVVYFDYPNYYVLIDGRAGMVEWVYGKPFIALRESLWGGHSTPSSIAQVLNKQSTDETSIAGYSVVAVHAWSQTAETVIQTINMLGEDVLVVKLDELIELMVNKASPKNKIKQSSPALHAVD